MKTKTFGWLLVLLFSSTTAVAGVTDVDPALKSYAKVGAVSGNISSVGSDTLNNLMTFWAEKFKAFYPNVNVQIEGKGSTTAPPALVAGTAQMGPMSRPMKQKEIDEFEKKFGYKPTFVRVAVDALAVFVHKDNPLKGMSLAQVDAVFSKTLRRGAKKNVATWGNLDLKGDWANRTIGLYGRNSASGTYGFFKEVALDGGDYKDQVKEQPGSASVVQSVGVDRYSMGYSGIGYKTAEVKALPIFKEGMAFVEATEANALTGDYPLARFLYVYVNKAPGKPLDPLTLEFFKLILSKEGQQMVIKGGYYPIVSSVAQEDLRILSSK
jgi:phosphate transport system substrate-binding protein